MPSESDLLSIAQRVVGWAQNGSVIEAFVGHESETEIRAYQGEVESLSSASSQGIGVRVVNEGRTGFAYTAALDDDSVRATYEEALDNCQFSSVDEFAGVASPDGVAPVDLDLYSTELVDYDPADKVVMAIELEKATLAADDRIIGVETAEYADTISVSAVANSAGVEGTSQETGCYLVVYPLASDGTETQTGFGFSVGRHPGELSLQTAASEAAERATRLLGATKGETKRLSVVLDPYVTAQLLGIIGSTLSGEAVLKGRSLFAGRLDSQVAADSVNLVDDPTDARAFSASSTDAEGLATRRVNLINNGVLASFLYDSYNARRASVTSTGSAVRGGYAGTPGVGATALALAAGTRQQSDIIADIDDGFLVQGVVGLHSGVNPVSGDFSAGAEGLRIRNGETAEPVREVTIGSTLQRLLLDVIEVGADVEWLPMGATGVSLAISDVTMSGQ